MREGVPQKETMTVEFKSDRKRLPDDDLVEGVVALANSEGGTIFLGVEDDGSVTGLHTVHDPPDGLAALVANRTCPSIEVRVERHEQAGHAFAKITIPKMTQLTSTTSGKYLRRRLKHDGTPENVPVLPHDVASRLSQLGTQDVTRQAVPNASLDDLDDVERRRLRHFIQQNQGDVALAALSDSELDAALGLTLRQAGVVRPSLAGLLVIGKEPALRTLVPTHEVAFQVLEREDVRTNEFSRAPLVRIIEWIENLIAPWNREEEIQVGLLRVPAPRFERRAFREAIANALTHRDYTKMGAVHVRLQDDALVISNPGGFVEGVTLDNLLTTEPRPRNASLADIFKRMGLVERTGRGVDIIYRGLLRYGRPHPDYSRSDSSSVVLRMPVGDADLAFLRLITDEENRLQAPLPIDSLIALSMLREQRRTTRPELQRAIQKDEAAATRTLEALRERGLVQSQGRGRGSTYILSAKVYTRLGKRSEYVRQAGFASLQQDHMIRQYVLAHGQIVRSDVVDLCGLGKDQATRLLARLVEEGVLVAEGDRRWRRYLPGPKLHGRVL